VAQGVRLSRIGWYVTSCGLIGRGSWVAARPARTSRAYHRAHVVACHGPRDGASVERLGLRLERAHSPASGLPPPSFAGASEVGEASIGAASAAASSALHAASSDEGLEPSTGVDASIDADEFESASSDRPESARGTPVGEVDRPPQPAATTDDIADARVQTCLAMRGFLRTHRATRFRGSSASPFRIVKVDCATA
jgi:hypothetical protein